MSQWIPPSGSISLGTYRPSQFVTPSPTGSVTIPSSGSISLGTYRPSQTYNPGSTIPGTGVTVPHR